MKCSKCQGNTLVHDTRDVSYSYKGKHQTVYQVTGHFCTQCEEIHLDEVEKARVKIEVIQFNRAVDKALSKTGFWGRFFK
jgi:HTH-type transcriptional regulator/antitoxin MqsA